MNILKMELGEFSLFYFGIALVIYFGIMIVSAFFVDSEDEETLDLNSFFFAISIVWPFAILVSLLFLIWISGDMVFELVKNWRFRK
jgi:hypothetical protein